ncbi:uncharacterized protein LOC115108497 isoform X2 [Oncorhynchus nerka]|uniref:uncharacterized protein LOC115108497 isoform X2 n=1 Tax=Oncorhynchus nerka TaxID=8023 RepID=UPI0031B80CDC
MHTASHGFHLINKTKEMIVDFRKQQREHPPIHIDGTVVERVVSFKFLGVHITDKLNWSTHTDSIAKKAQQRLFNLRRLKKFGLSPKALTNFYRCTIESILSGCITAWYGNCSAHNRKALQRVVRSAQRITGGKLPALQDTYTTRCHRKAIKIIKDNNHPSHCLFTLLSSRGRGVGRSRSGCRLLPVISYWTRSVQRTPQIRRSIHIIFFELLLDNMEQEGEEPEDWKEYVHGTDMLDMKLEDIMFSLKGIILTETTE